MKTFALKLKQILPELTFIVCNLQILTHKGDTFSQQYYPWINHYGHEYKENDCELKKLLIARQILLVSTTGNIIMETSMENLHTDVKV